MNTAPCSVLLSLLPPGQGKNLIIPCLLREEIIDNNDNIWLHSDDQISPQVSFYKGWRSSKTSLVFTKALDPLLKPAEGWQPGFHL